MRAHARLRGAGKTGAIGFFAEGAFGHQTADNSQADCLRVRQPHPPSSSPSWRGSSDPTSVGSRDSFSPRTWADWSPVTSTGMTERMVASHVPYNVRNRGKLTSSEHGRAFGPLIRPVGPPSPAGEKGKPAYFLFCRFAIRSSTTAGSARVDVSPSAPKSSSAILRRMRRMILPERVLGRPGAN
jgi:hypothetical protein